MAPTIIVIVGVRGGERVPIRWMAPESIDTNIYNEATDVVCGLMQTMIENLW